MPDAIEPQLDELRRRARRRLVGAVVLALAAAVLVPMLLESDPKPLGEDVSVKIPPVDDGKFVSKLGEKSRAAESAPAPAAKPAPAPNVDRCSNRCVGEGASTVPPETSRRRKPRPRDRRSTAKPPIKEAPAPPAKDSPPAGEAPSAPQPPAAPRQTGVRSGSFDADRRRERRRSRLPPRSACSWRRSRTTRARTRS